MLHFAILTKFLHHHVLFNKELFLSDNNSNRINAWDISVGVYH